MGLLNFEWVSGRPRGPATIPLLAVENISVRLAQRLVLEDVRLDVYEGDQVRITGPNGAGKSTLLNAIMGVVPVTAGRILFKGEDLSPLPTHERTHRGIRYMRQRDNVFPSLSVRDNLRLALGADGYERFRECCPEWARDLAPHTPAGMLSGGQKQKLAWGMTMGSNSGKLLLIDEATVGIAGESRPSTPLGKTFLVVEH